jgi:hypothetical protein
VQTQRGSSSVLRIGYILVTIGLVVLIAAVVGVFAISLAGAFGSGDTSIGTTVTISTDQLDSLPDGVALAERTPVTLRIQDPTLGQHAMTLVGASLFFVLTFVVLVFLRRILGSVRHGDPFIAANVRRLRVIGSLLLIGVPLFVVISQFIVRALVETSDVSGVGIHIAVPWTPALAGLGVLILAQVFAHGVQLREDVEGTV